MRSFFLFFIPTLTIALFLFVFLKHFIKNNKIKNHIKIKKIELDNALKSIDGDGDNIEQVIQLYEHYLSDPIVLDYENSNKIILTNRSIERNVHNKLFQLQFLKQIKNSSETDLTQLNEKPYIKSNLSNF